MKIFKRYYNQEKWEEDSDYGSQLAEINDIYRIKDELIYKLKIAKEALRFYESNYGNVNSRGQIARETLKELDER